MPEFSATGPIAQRAFSKPAPPVQVWPNARMISGQLRDGNGEYKLSQASICPEKRPESGRQD
jgi:hypothetical protein